ncbi:Crp/Fnr family transcriptional regulator [Hyphomonas sp. NPDC076900]|uniref:Crp/Fnr family transcriptional regulator n=1 Tax=unclassified Hyphomonas TaxID=2630699 RepID=UPI003CFE3B79
MHIAGQLNWINELPAPARAAIRERFVYRDIETGETIKESGQPADGMYQIQSGFVKLLADRPDGERSLLMIYIRGNSFGESPMVARRPHHHTTVAASPARIGFLKQDDFDELYRTHPSIPEALCRKFAAGLSSMFAFREKQTETTVAQRVALVLHNLAEMSETPQIGSQRAIDIPITIAELSSFLGLTRQTVQKEISLLKRRNLISKSQGAWAVRDMEALRALAPTAEAPDPA